MERTNNIKGKGFLKREESHILEKKKKTPNPSIVDGRRGRRQKMID